MQQSKILIAAIMCALAGLFMLVADLAEKLSDRRLLIEVLLLLPLFLYSSIWPVRSGT